jgi:hypothetical protein
MASITYQVSVQVTGGPRISVTDTLKVDAYDVIDVSIAAASSASVEIEPAAGAGRVLLLMIHADSYADLTYEVGGTKFTLDGPVLLAGKGSVGLLDSKPGTIKFTNAHATAARPIHVLVGRKATA